MANVMNEQEMVVLFTALAMSGVSTHSDKMSVEDIAKRSSQIAIATLATLKNKGFQWPGAAETAHPTRDEMNDLAVAVSTKTEPSPPPDVPTSTGADC